MVGSGVDQPPHRARPQPWLTIPLAVVAVLIGSIGVAVASQRPLTASPTTTTTVAPPTTTATIPPTTTLPPTTTTTAAPRPAPVVVAAPAPAPAPEVPIQVPVSTVLAAAHGEIPKFDGPGGQQIGTAGFFDGYPMTMPVLQQQDGWLRVRLPERPNGSTAWVRATDVTTSETPYRLVLRRSRTTLFLYKGGVPIQAIPVGVGKAATPTPLGSFFIAVNEGSGPPGYGPVVLDTSAHSEAIRSWDGTGDAIIAIHGPITAGSDAQIGTRGTAISNGCIRLHVADQIQLAIIPLGTPVDILP